MYNQLIVSTQLSRNIKAQFNGGHKLSSLKNIGYCNIFILILTMNKTYRLVVVFV